MTVVLVSGLHLTCINSTTVVVVSGLHHSCLPHPDHKGFDEVVTVGTS
jgi:hypothetical protein